MDAERLKRLLEWTVNVLIIGLLAFLIAQPGSPVRQRFDHWRSERIAVREIAKNWDDLSLAGVALGFADGPADLIEFSDYQCPACRQAHPAVMDLVRSRPELRVRYIHKPIATIHPQAESAAKAAICAEAQGTFGPMHTYLMEEEAWFNDPDWKGIAADVGIPSTAQFLECMDAESTLARLAAELEWSERVHVTGTPTFTWADGRQHRVPDAETITTILKAR